MSSDLQLLAYSAVLTWVMLMTASLMRSGGVSPEAMKVAFGNRDGLPEPKPIVGRADRAAKNMLENLVLFVAVLVAAHGAGANPDRVLLGARLFFFARLAYWPIYLAGITHVRTLVWSIGVAGMAIIVAATI
jgi:uncharacterized MAPEG superfamily protein